MSELFMSGTWFDPVAFHDRLPMLTSKEIESISTSSAGVVAIRLYDEERELVGFWEPLVDDLVRAMQEPSGLPR